MKGLNDVKVVSKTPLASIACISRAGFSFNVGLLSVNHIPYDYVVEQATVEG